MARTPAEIVTDVLGVRPLARQLEVSPSTVVKWKVRREGRIPSVYHRKILELAGGALTANDLVYGRE